MSAKETIAILGGTGDLGTGLAIRWSKAGYNSVIGSRTQEKADAAVAALASSRLMFGKYTVLHLLDMSSLRRYHSTSISVHFGTATGFSFRSGVRYAGS